MILYRIVRALSSSEYSTMVGGMFRLLENALGGGDTMLEKVSQNKTENKRN